MTRSFLCISRGDSDIHKSKHYVYRNKLPMLCKTCSISVDTSRRAKATSWAFKKKKKLMVWIQSESLDPKLGDAGIIIEYSQSTINIYSLQKNRPVPAFFSQRFYKPP